MMDLIRKLEQIDKKLNYGAVDRQGVKNEITNNKSERPDNCSTIARSTEEINCSTIAEKDKLTDKEPENLIKKDMEEVNSKLWSLRSRNDTMSRDQAKSSCALRS